ncbi:MAG: hypothetical protein FJ404_05060 [Verrucomicrobia bacterium]|nr:hypothetical protein [Verrucomicrobiota bacterium]
MKPRVHHSLPCLALLSWLALASHALACRYSVRDTGFVDLGEESYSFELQGVRDASVIQHYRRTAVTVFSEANIQFTSVEPRLDEVPAASLRDRNGRRLELARGTALPLEPKAITALLESVAESPLRRDLQEASLRHFAVVLLLDGEREAENVRVVSMAEQAIRHIATQMPSMPKPVKSPPVLRRVSQNQQSGESIALWGLGLDSARSDDPRVAVVFGRARRLGGILEGALITRTALQEHLAILGQDCECELDRSWMKGPVLPGRWDQDRQKETARALGFDPENPMVRTEISRIVHRGPGAGPRRKLPAQTQALRYSENALDELPAADVDREETPDPSGNLGSIPLEEKPTGDTHAKAIPGSPAPVTGPNSLATAAENPRPLPLSLIALATLLGVGTIGWWWVKVGKDRG